MSKGESFLLSFDPNGVGGFTVRDGRGRRYDVVNEDSLWTLIHSLNNDPGMPRMQVNARNDAIGIVAGIGRRVAPKHAELFDAVEPVAHHASSLVPVVGKYIDRWRRERRERNGE